MEGNEKKTENVQEKTEAAEQKMEIIPEMKTNVQMIQEDFDRSVTEKSADNVDGHVRINKAYFKQYLQICTNLYINYTVIDKVLDITKTKALFEDDPDSRFLLTFIKEAKEFTLFNLFIDMLEQAQNGALDFQKQALETKKQADDTQNKALAKKAEVLAKKAENYYSRYEECLDKLENMFGLERQIFEGLRQIRLGIFAKTEENRKFLHLSICDLEEYFGNEEITEYQTEREIAARQSFYNEADAEKEESYIGRGIGEHAVPTMKERGNLLLKFDYNAREKETFSIVDAQKIIEHLKSDLSGIEFNPLGINHMGAFFMANLGDTKRMKMLDETPAVKTNPSSVGKKTTADLADVPSKYEKLWLSTFKPIAVTLAYIPDYRNEMYKDFQMPFYVENLMYEILRLNNKKPSCQHVKEYLTKMMGTNSSWDKERHCGLSEDEITTVLNHIPANYIFGQSDDDKTVNRDEKYVYECLSKIDNMVLQKQMDNFVYDADNIVKLPKDYITRYAQNVSRTPLYIKKLVELLENYPSVIGSEVQPWLEKFETQRIEAADAFRQFEVGKITMKYTTRYEKDLLEQLALAVQDESLDSEAIRSVHRMMETITLEISQRNSWRIIRTKSTEEKFCIVNESAFYAMRNQSNDDVFETETPHWKQNIYSLSHLIESIISSVETLDTNAFKRLEGVEDRRPVKEQKYDALYGAIPTLDTLGKKVTPNSDASDQDSGLFAEISSFAIVKPFVVDTNESELLKLILTVRKNYAYDVLFEEIDIKEIKESFQKIFNRYHQTIKLKFLLLNLDELLDLAEECGIRKEAENLRENVSDEYQAKAQIRELILQAIKKEIETKKQTASQGNSKASKGN